MATQFDEARLEEIQSAASKMIYEDANRDVAMLAYQEMAHNGWNLPDEVKQMPWIRKVISSDPENALKTGDRILSTLPMSIRYQPIAPGLENKKRANMIENILKWQVKSANRRKGKGIESDVARSALTYDAVAMQVIDLDYQIEQKMTLQADAKREKAARRYSRFLTKIYNPRFVHVRYSDLMPEAVLLVQYKHAQQVIDEWGDKAKDIPGMADLASRSHDDDWVTYYDYWDYYTRAAWLQEGIMVTPEITMSMDYVLDVGDSPTPFLPWVCLMGGSELEDDPEHKYQPLLYSVYTSGAWETQNIVKTLAVSEAIALSGSPRFVDEGPTQQEADIEYMSPERIAKAAPQHIIRALQPPDFSSALATVDAMQAAQIDKSTLSRILQGGEVPAGIAFASLNLITQNSVSVLKPAKDLAEKALAEMCTLMLLWTEFTGEDLYGYSGEKNEEGTEMVISADEIDPMGIYIECELHPDAPTDRQQRVNTAAIAVDQLDMPKEMAMEEIGITDPIAAQKTRWLERKLEHVMEMRMQREMMMMEAEIEIQTQQRIMMMQMEMQQAMQQAQQVQQMPEQGMSPDQIPVEAGMEGGEGIRPGPRGVPRGQGVNPAGGGQPPANFNPEETREIVGGEDMLGNEVMI